MHKQTLDIAVAPHPFALTRERFQLEAGLSVAALVARVQSDPFLARYAHVYVDGEYIHPMAWEDVFPSSPSVVTIRMVPQGGGSGGGKNPLRTVLSLALTATLSAATGGLASLLPNATFMGFNITRGLTAGFNLLGRLALNALAPPPRARLSAIAKESPTLFIQAARNQYAPFSRVPRVLGRHRFVPPMGARPYTESEGNDQYLRMLFVWGYGPLEISDLKIGETPLTEFTGVQVETRRGLPGDPPLTLYTNSVLQNDLQVALTAAAGFVTRTSETDADELSIDITWGRGLFLLNGRGEKSNATVAVDIQYSPKGQNSWSAGSDAYTTIAAQSIAGIARPAAYISNGATFETVRIYTVALDPASGKALLFDGPLFRREIDSGGPEEPAIPEDVLPVARIERRSSDTDTIPSSRLTDIRDMSRVGGVWQSPSDFQPSPGAPDALSLAAGGLKFFGLVVTARQSAALRKSVRFRVPRGQYDVRVRRRTADSSDSNLFDEASWTALRTVRRTQPVLMPGIAMTALRIKATDQLSGVIDRFNGIAHSVLPDWNGTSWVSQPTSNPASVFRHILQGNANARPLPDSRLDLNVLQDWHAHCADAGREFNAVVDYDVSVQEILQDVAATGRAAATLIDGKWGVVEDRPQTVPVQHFTPRNTYNFRGEKSFDDIPDALRTRFVNREKGWQQDEILVYADGIDIEQVRKYETLELHGVTSPEQAWRDGRYHLEVARRRTETYSFYADAEHIVCTRGDLIRFTHDVPLFGLMSARVKAMTVDSGLITAVTFDAGMPMESGKNYSARFRAADGSSIVAPLVTSPGTHLSLALATPLAVAAGPGIGDLALFGESGQESVELIVKSVEPKSDLAALITCVASESGVHIASAAPLPPFFSVLTGVGTELRPPAPIATQIQSGMDVMIRHADGSLTSRIVITLTPPVFYRPLTLTARIRGKDESEFRPAETLSFSGNRVSITDVAEGDSIDVELRYAAADGAISAPLIINGYRVEGASAPPSDVSGFSLHVLGDTAHVSWQAVSDIDLSHYTLRFAPQTEGVTWGSAVDLVARVSPDTTALALPAAVGTYLIKAVDVGGRQSVAAAAAISTIAGIAGYNAVLTVTEDSAFDGSKDGVAAPGGVLRLAGIDTIDDWSDVDAVINTDIGNSGLESEGTYIFATTTDLGAVYTSRLTADMNAVGIDLSSVIDIWNDLDILESWDQSISPSLWSAQLYIRRTNDNPSASPVWSDFSPFSVGDYSARAFQFKLVLKRFVDNVTPELSRLRVAIDMPDRTEGRNGLISDVGGSGIAFQKPFRAVPALSITAQDMMTGDYYAITGQTATGFSIRFFSADGTGIVRTFDYLAKGYGQYT